MGKIGIGIIELGLGELMLGIRQISNTDLEIRGICDTNVNRLESVRTQYQPPFATTDYRELIRQDEINIVGIYTPDPLHARHCLDALDCGKHVICTKGFVDNLDDAIRVLQRTRETGLKLLVGQTCRFVPDFMHTYRSTESGRLGHVVAVEAHYVHDMRSVLTATPWRLEIPDASETALRWTVSPIDLVVWFLGFPCAVHAIAHESGIDERYPSGKGRFNDNWMVNLIYADGRLGVYGLCHPPMPMLGLSVYGTTGSVVNGQAVFDDNYHKIIPVSEAIGLDTDYLANTGHVGEVVRYMLHFEDCLKHDKQPLIDAEVGAKVIAVLDVCERSARSGKVVKCTIRVVVKSLFRSKVQEFIYALRFTSYQRRRDEMARKLRMVRLNLDGLPELEIPQGYEIRTYQEGDDVHWANVINASFGGERTVEDTHRDIIDRDVFDPTGLYFATYQGMPVGTACAWKNTSDETAVGIVHMVGVDSEHTGHKLGKCVSLCVLLHLQKHGFKCVILNTDEFRLPAVKTYLNLGFLPVYVDADQPERWRQIFEKLGLPVMPDQSEKIRAELSDEMWAKVCG